MTTSKPFAGGRVTAVVALTGALLTAAAGTSVMASGSREGLQGAWAVQVTLRDCVTNATLGAPFNSLVSFHDGGTLSETAGSLGFAAGRGLGPATFAHRPGAGERGGTSERDLDASGEHAHRITGRTSLNRKDSQRASHL